MYDGYYIYSPTYVPQTITDSATSLKNNATGGNINDIEQGNGKQLFYYENGPTDKKLTNSAIQTINGVETVGKPIYEAKDGKGQQETFSFSTSKNNRVETKKITIKFTTDRNDAKTTYKHVLKTFVPYTTNYTKNGTNYVINYTLDNYVRIYKENEAWEGYIITEYGNETKYNVPVKSTTITFNGTTIEPEVLSENIPVRNSRNDNIEVKNYAYIYNSNNDKRYYESEAGENQGKFFIINSEYVKVYLPDAKVNNSLAEYKKLLIRFEEGSPDYIELYQLLNKDEGNTWYYKDSNGKYNKYSAYQPTINRNRDCSAINYYVENYLFNYWIKNEGLNTDNIMNLKKQSIIDNVNKNLNLAISNYSENSKINYTIPELSDEDWEQALSNISMITFFQGMKVGLKTYNNYSVVTSRENNEYVGEDSLYYLNNQDESYHRYRCSNTQPNIGLNGAYKNTEFKAQSYTQKDDTINYYYKHGNIGSEGRMLSMLQCFDCIVNRNNIKAYTGEESQKRLYFEKAYNTGLARERYIQMSRSKLTGSKGKIVEEEENTEEPKKEVTVTFDAKSGRLPDKTSKKVVTYNGTYGPLPVPIPLNKRYKFNGWYTEEGQKVTSTTIVDTDKDHTLYAQYIRFIAPTVPTDPTDPTDPTETEDFSASISNIQTVNQAGKTTYTATIYITGGKAPYTIVRKVGRLTTTTKTDKKTYNIIAPDDRRITYTISDSNGNSTVLTFTGGTANS